METKVGRDLGLPNNTLYQTRHSGASIDRLPNPEALPSLTLLLAW